MRVESVRFGEFDVPEESVLEFSSGIFGFPHLRRCCLLPYGGTAGLRWIQSLEDPTLLFLSVEPYLVFPEYEAEIPDSEAQALELGSAEEAAVLTLVTVCPDTQTVSANLLAPVVINMRTRQARQVLLDTDRYLTKHAIGGEIKDGLHAGVDAQGR